MNSVEKIQLPLAAARSVLGRRPARPRRIAILKVHILRHDVSSLPVSPGCLVCVCAGKATLARAPFL